MPLHDIRDGSADGNVTAQGTFQSGRFVASEDQKNNLIIDQDLSAIEKSSLGTYVRHDFKESKMFNRFSMV